MKIFRGVIAGGNEGGEMSWKIEGYAEVKVSTLLYNLFPA